MESVHVCLIADGICVKQWQLYMGYMSALEILNYSSLQGQKEVWRKMHLKEALHVRNCIV